jgi:hypothetical protein
MSIQVNYIYLLKEREFLKTNENIYKIGKTTQKNYDRFKQYPNGSILLYQTICDNCHTLERELLSIFKNKFIHRKDIGNEYFEGSYSDMIDIIANKANNKLINIDDEKKTNDKQTKKEKKTNDKETKKEKKIDDKPTQKEIEIIKINDEKIDCENFFGNTSFHKCIFMSRYEEYTDEYFSLYLPIVIAYNDDYYYLFNYKFELLGTKGYTSNVTINNCAMKNIIWVTDYAKLSIIDKPWETKKRLKSYIRIYDKLFDKHKLLLKRLLNLNSVTIID